MSNISTLPRVPPSSAAVYCLANLVIPGAGYVMAGDRARGVILFIVINIVFFIGIFYGGYIEMPAFQPRHPEFNLVAVLTYVAQAFHGGGWLGLQYLHAFAGENAEGLFSLHRMAIKPYSDLGIFHLVVAGGLNYFATMRLWDLLAGEPELSQTLKDAKGQPEDSAEKGKG